MKEELVKREAALAPDDSSRTEWLARLRKEVDVAREIIEASDVPAELNALRLRSELISAAASRLRSEDLAIAACEVQSRAERRLGYLRSFLSEDRGGRRGSERKFDYAEAKRLRAEGLSFNEIADRLNVAVNTVRYAARKGFPDVPQYKDDTRAAFDRELDLRGNTGSEMTRLARMDEATFNTAILSLIAKHRHPTRQALIRAVNNGEKKRVERHIYRLPDGRLQLRLRRQGRNIQRTLHGATAGDLNRARRELAKLKGALSHSVKVRGSTDLTAVAADAQKLMQRLDRLIMGQSGIVRSELRHAYTHGERMEQAIIRAINAVPV